MGRVTPSRVEWNGINRTGQQCLQLSDQQLLLYPAGTTREEGSSPSTTAYSDLQPVQQYAFRAPLRQRREEHLSAARSMSQQGHAETNALSKPETLALLLTLPS